MKKAINLVFSAAWFVAMGIYFSSCAPSAPPQQDTTTLLSAPPTLSLTRMDSTQSSAISLSCGCPFGKLYINSGPFMVTGYGDTSTIKFSFKETLDTLVNIHTLYASITPSVLPSPGSSSSWIALYYNDYGQNPLYDTIRVTATY